MRHRLGNCVAAALCGLLALSASASQRQPEVAEEAAAVLAEQPYAHAEQFVEVFLYDAMIVVWSTDRRAWNQILQVKACGDMSQQGKLQHAYEATQPLFSEAVLTLAERQQMFTSAHERAILDDVAQLAFRLFSSSYAHGYARQIWQAEQLSPGLKEEMCGTASYPSALSNIALPASVSWQNQPAPSARSKHATAQLTRHALKGYAAFAELVASRYLEFDALVFSHAYEQPEAYQKLFSAVTDYQNVQQYLNYMAPSPIVGISPTGETSHADFAYLMLSSGYHWGTLSVLALLEEDYPHVHERARSRALEQVKQALLALNE